MSHTDYNVGDLVQIKKQHGWNAKGIIVSIHLKPREERQIYWFAHEYNYLVSIDDFKGDYKWVDIDGMVKLNLPIEYKLSTVSKFDDWWYGLHKSVYQNLLIEALN